jgi:hypothetical protein
MTGWRRTAAALGAGIGIAACLVIGSGTMPVRGVVPLPVATPSLPVTIPSLPIPSLPIPTVPLPTPSVPLPSLPLPSPSLPIPSLPLPSIELGSPLPSLGTPRPSPTPGEPGASALVDGPRPADSGQDEDADGSPPPASEEGGPPGAPGDGPIVDDQPWVAEPLPLPPSLPSVGSWLVPALGAAVPALLVVLLVAAQIIGGAAGLRAAGVTLDRSGAHVPPWLGSRKHGIGRPPT